MLNTRPVRLLPLTAALLLGGCSTIGGLFGSDSDKDRVDYRSQAVKTPPLEVPPDLSQLSREGRFTVQSERPASVSASTFGQPGTPVSAVGGPAVTPNAVGEVRLIREGSVRRLQTTLAPEVVYQRALNFWKDAGFSIETERPEAGVIETGWAENRAKLPKDFIRSMLGRLGDGVFSTGERDRFRTRIERSAQGTEISISHRGLIEGPRAGSPEIIAWGPRPSDPELEAEFLYRLMARLGAPEAQVQQARAEGSTGGAAAATARPGAATPAAAAPARARLVPNAGLQIDDNFDRAWRQVGLALDRGGFTVEDRDRASGTYFVRYVDRTGGGDKGLFSRLGDFFRSDESKAKLARYRIVVKEEAGGKSTVGVLNANGQAESSENTKQMLEALLRELR